MDRITPAQRLRTAHQDMRLKVEAQGRPVTLQDRIRAQVQGLVEAFMPTSDRKATTEGYARATIVLGRHVYGGTVSPKVIAKRRARNRMARKTRQAQRRHG